MISVAGRVAASVDKRLVWILGLATKVIEILRAQVNLIIVSIGME